MATKNVILAIDYVEAGLVRAVKKIGDELQINIEPIVLVDKKFKEFEDYKKSDRSYFKEIVCDFNDPTSLQQTLKPYQDRLLAASCRNDAAIPDYRKAIPFLPYIDTPTETSLVWATEKRLMRDRLRDFEESLVPRYKKIALGEAYDIEQLAREFTFPVIVKPNGLRLSLLVNKCDSKEELASCLEKTFSVIEGVYDKEAGIGIPTILVEEFMQGDLYSVDVYVSPSGDTTCMPPIRTITAHEKGMDGFYGCEFILPVDLTDQQIEKAYETSVSAVKALNLRSCPAHVELYRLADDSWKIVELGPRLGGHRDELYMAAYGIDHYYNDLASRIDGLEIELPANSEGGDFVSCMGIYPHSEGRIKSIEGLDQAAALEDVVSIDQKMQPGDKAIFAQNGGRSAVHASLKSTSRDKLVESIQKVRDSVKIITE